MEISIYIVAHRKGHETVTVATIFHGSGFENILQHRFHGSSSVSIRKHPPGRNITVMVKSAKSLLLKNLVLHNA